MKLFFLFSDFLYVFMDSLGDVDDILCIVFFNFLEIKESNIMYIE